MNTSLSYTVKLPSVEQDFKKHIEQTDNKRILFSAKFGAGKSTFLNEYFETKENDFIVLKLYPVNYSVASNEDVFELIKYNLFSELLAKYPDKLNMNNEDYSTLLMAQSYLSHEVKIYPFIKALLKAAVPNGEAVAEVVDAAKAIFKEFKSYQEKIQQKEVDVIDDYIQWCEKRKGSIYERDEITSLIGDLISRVKINFDNRPVVLIIDDLDRLDPEHVFRLFNVFSAHYDSIIDANKFGVDKVIFVCDYHNIELMYKHRYGEGVDFEGYINKFYSLNIFKFDTTRYLLESIEDLLLSKPSATDSLRFKRYAKFDRDNLYVQAISLLYSDLIRNKVITFRNLYQFKNYFVSDYEVTIGESKFHASNFYFITFINLITQAISLNHLEDALDNLANNASWYTFDEYQQNRQFPYNWLIKNSLYMFLSGKQLAGYSNEKTTSIEIDNITYTLSLNYDFETGTIIPQLNMPLDTTYNIYKFLSEAIKAGKRHNLFR